jgi:hypothetical protein
MRRSLVVLAILVGVVSAAGPAAPRPLHHAGVVIGKDPAGDVSAAGLTSAERDAVDIVSVKAVGMADLGVVVTATFRGNFERAIGHGHLANAAAMLILEPDSSGATSAGVVTDGPGKVGRVLRHTKSTDVGAVRRGNQVTFVVGGPGYDHVKSLEVRTVIEPQSLRTLSAASDGPPYMVGRLWDKFIRLHPLDHRPLTTNPDGLSCPELQDLLTSIDQDLDDPYFAANVSGAVVQALYKFRSTVQSLLASKCPPPGGTTPTPALGATFTWHVFSSNEIAGAGQFTGPATTLDGIRVVLPGNFTITNKLCPIQLPNAVISGSSISCGGGTLTTGQPFTLNLQTVPNPPAGIGGQLFGDVTGTTVGPFTITGP